MRFQYRCVVLTPSKVDGPQTSALQLRENVTSFARNVAISGEGFNWEYLGRILSEFEILHSISWRSWKEAVPRSIFRHLTTRFPQIHINLEQFPVGDQTTSLNAQRQELDLTDGLLGFGNIVSICVVTNYEHQISMRRIMEVAMTCSILDLLELRVSLGLDYELHESHRSGAHDFGLHPGDKLPPVRKLVYESCLLEPVLPLIPPTFWNWQSIQHLEIRGEAMETFIMSITHPLDEDLVYLQQSTASGVE